MLVFYMLGSCPFIFLDFHAIMSCPFILLAFGVLGVRTPPCNILANGRDSKMLWFSVYGNRTTTVQIVCVCLSLTNLTWTLFHLHIQCDTWTVKVGISPIWQIRTAIPGESWTIGFCAIGVCGPLGGLVRRGEESWLCFSQESGATCVHV